MSNLINPSRRGFLAGLGSLFIAAPAIVRVASIMPVKAVDVLTMDDLLAANAQFGPIDWSELAVATRKAFMPRILVQIYETNPILATLNPDWYPEA